MILMQFTFTLAIERIMSSDMTFIQNRGHGFWSWSEVAIFFIDGSVFR